MLVHELQGTVAPALLEFGVRQPKRDLWRDAQISVHERALDHCSVGLVVAARGLEAAVVDNEWMVVSALDPADHRRHDVRVAGPALQTSILASDLIEAVEGEARPS